MTTATHDIPAAAAPEERLRRWRLVLGAAAEADCAGLAGADAGMDAALAALYDNGGGGGADDTGGPRSAGLGASAPRVARWLGDIRTYFPSSVVRVMQADAVERLGLDRLLLEPEMLDAVEPDVHLVGTLLSLNQVMPQRARESARAVVRAVVRDLERRLAQRTRSVVRGALDRSARTHRPRRAADIDWNGTIRRNLQHYLPEHGTIVPQNLVGYGRRTHGVQRHVTLAIDQSGSMAESVVYASVFGAVLGSMRTLRTSLVVFDTAVVDLTEELSDPVEVLFGTQLGGGTDINRAIAYCQGLITRPADSVFVLISDLYEGGIRDEMLQRVAAMTAAGVQVVVLLALSDEGAPSYDRDNAAALAAMGVPAFACTPDAFPELMAAAIQGHSMTAWAERRQDHGADGDR
ncbi:VWA domain containing CoxE-like protein [Murinocardiopsis flavida]|uniref:VWA domain containing CoxE-like protein n=1 Tax=Murinocardiopsis flavida TaxID=645275 RepID=A0A2P8CZ28_9ACTN|nr:VWA domain-containing protein [Murinocardiopsis flavida]PSK90232.1 VWA domain containing CoxE-like protein [Murinocardiopsis flavida]